MYRYENGICNLNTYAIRQCVGEYFSSPIKRNASDFFIALCEKYDYIKSLVRHQITSIRRCKTCDNTKTTVDNNIIISIPINHLKKKTCNLNELLNITFSHWYQSHNETCEYCTGNDIIFKKELILSKEIVVIRVIFSSQDNKLTKATQKFNLSAIPTTKVLIDGHLYKVMNAIFYYGSNIDEGHYISMCREGTSNIWIEVNDAQVKKRQWPRGAKDVYLLFLQKM